MRNEYGQRVLQVGPRWHGKRVCRWLPRRGEVVIRLLGATRWYRVQWLPREGYWITSAGLVGAPAEVNIYNAPRYQGDAMKRRQPVMPGAVIRPPLPATSTFMPKSPALREFISATAYDDGTPRTPGGYQVRNKETTYEVTVYDPDSGTRLVVRGPDLDHAFALVEKLLSAEEAPWETDRYLTEQLQKKAPRKRT